MKIDRLAAALVAACALMLPLAARAEDPDEAEYQRRWRSAANAVARLERFAARWCADNGLHAAALHEWQESLDLEPESEDARKALGFVRKKGEWVADPAVVVKKDNEGDPKDLGEAIDTYRKKRAGIVSTAARELAPLAAWAEDKGYALRAKKLWELVRRFDPENQDACKAVGWKLAGDRWFPEAEAASRRAALELMEKGDGGKSSKDASALTKPLDLKIERRRSPHFTFEGRATQTQLDQWLRGAEATRTILYDLLQPAEEKRPGALTGVFLTSQSDHAKFLEKCTEMSEDDRRTYEVLGGWSTFTPTVAFEVWTRGDLPEYHREAGIHISVHMLFQASFGLAKPESWLSEGLALWFTDRLTGTALARCTDLMGNQTGEDRSPSTAGWRARLRSRMREGTAPSLRAIFRAHADDLDRDKMIVSWSFVSFLASQPEKFRAFVRKISEREDTIESLFEVLEAKDYDALQAKWEGWVLENS
ncbi:MAG: hypothetical protein K8T20_01365 [Planctomycetes bacterium]|nr:hypothetical protein [Planctomycetota bacterium]